MIRSYKEEQELKEKILELRKKNYPYDKIAMELGIGKEGYSIIGQGKIDAILSGKAEDRRALLEEAAGIVKYKSRKEEAEKRLDNTDNNLVRIRDIIATYEERLEPLRMEKV